MSQSSSNNNKIKSAPTKPDNSSVGQQDLGAKLTSAKQEGFVCPKCGATKVAKSRSQSFDSLFMRFIPRRPYRCMRCYHRFWHKEKFFADPRRPRSWLILVGVIVILLAVKTQLFFATNSNSADQPNYPADGADSSRVGEANLRGAKIVKAGKELSGQTGTKSLSSADKKRLIESSGFNEAMPASAMEAPPDVGSKELKRRLAEAKTQVEAAKKLSKEKAENLDAEVNGQPEELRSLARIDINYRIEQWRQAWQTGDIEPYLGFYSPNFTPRAGLTLADWQKSRRTRVSPERQITLVLAKFEVTFSKDNQSSVVVFDQQYRSKNYVEESRKQLVLKKQDDQWYIVSEEQVD